MGFGFILKGASCHSEARQVVVAIQESPDSVSHGFHVLIYQLQPGPDARLIIDVAVRLLYKIELICDFGILKSRLSA